ncbi:MAG: TldD/PmbA family protein [Peptoniphilaceae bacterium]
MKKLKTSKFLLENKKRLKFIVDELGKTFEYVSLLGTDTSGRNYSVSSSSISVAPSNDEERGFVIRVFQDCGVTEYSFNKIDEEEIIEKVKKLAKEDRLVFLKNNSQLSYPNKPKDEAIVKSFVQEVENLPEDNNPEEIIKRLSKIHNDTREEYKKLVHVIVTYFSTQVNKLFISKNKELYQSYIYSTGYAVAIASDGENTKEDFLSVSNMGGVELLDEVEKLAKLAGERAEELLGAERVVSGEYDIICDQDFTGLIAHEAFGHGAEMDMFVKERAKGQEYINKRVASDKVVMHDGASAARECSSYLFDDEGNLGKDTVIIENGILKKGMCDELSGLILGVEPTGNGKRESYKRKSYTRMTNTFFEEGEDSLDDMIASIKKGYLLEGFSSGMEDPKNWGIQCVASKGREIINGKLTGKIVSPVYLTGYVPDLLESISMVSPGLKLSGSGYCGKGWKEWVKTSTGGSYIKAKGKLS